MHSVNVKALGAGHLCPAVSDPVGMATLCRTFLRCNSGPVVAKRSTMVGDVRGCYCGKRFGITFNRTKGCSHVCRQRSVFKLGISSHRC